MKIINPLIHKVNHNNITKQFPKTNKVQADFQSILQKKLNEITISKHAKERIENRGIEIDSITMYQLNEAMDKLSEKGSKDSLILLNQVAYIVNPQQKVIITCVDKEHMQENIFSGIDSAIIL